VERTLEPRYYVSEATFDAERERLWARQWVLVGRDDALTRSGDRMLVDVAGSSVVVVRGDDETGGGVLRGFHNVCRHRGAELLDTGGLTPADLPACGSFGSVIKCPYHSWAYGLDGTLRHAPFVDRVDAGELAGVRLHPVAVDTWGGFVFVHLGQPEQTLAEQIGAVAGRTARYPLADLRVGLTLRYEVAANWKVLAENYNECYHCGPVHPELCDLVPAFRRGGDGLEWPDGIPHRDGAWTFTTTGTTNRAPFPGLDDAERVRHKGELVYPNLLLSLSADHVAAFRLEPRGPAHTTVVCELLFHPEAIADAGFDPSDAGDLWHLVNLQDWAICESVQRGMSSPAWTGGWMAPTEDAAAEITRWYLPLMEQA